MSSADNDVYREQVEQVDWLIRNSDGVAGLRLDGAIMPWPEVIDTYLPAFADKDNLT